MGQTLLRRRPFNFPSELHYFAGKETVPEDCPNYCEEILKACPPAVLVIAFDC